MTDGLIPIAEVAGGLFMLIGFFAFMGIVSAREKFKIYMQNRKKHRNTGIIWVWTVAALTLFVFSIIWATIGFVSHYYLETVTALFPDAYVGNMGKSLQTIDMTFFLLPLIIIGGVLLWAVVNSMRREEVSQPVGYY